MLNSTRLSFNLFVERSTDGCFSTKNLPYLFCIPTGLLRTNEEI